MSIASLSLFAWNRRETPFRLPHLTSFLWISATVLRSGVCQRAVRVARRSNLRRQLIHRIMDGLTELFRFPLIHTPVKHPTDISAK
jgi:hypothetical protein